MPFDRLPELGGGGYRLRPLTEADRADMWTVAADAPVWAQNPAKDRATPEGFARYFDFLLSAGTLGIVDEAAGRVIGCSCYYTAPDRPGTISIGYTVLARPYWGGAANKAVKRLMLAHAFADFPDVWFHIDPGNIRSQKATGKLGARFEYDAVLNLGGGPQPWKCYRLSSADWTAVAEA